MIARMIEPVWAWNDQIQVGHFERRRSLSEYSILNSHFCCLGQVLQSKNYFIRKSTTQPKAYSLNKSKLGPGCTKSEESLEQEEQKEQEGDMWSPKEPLSWAT